jgi:hypothetical protein
MRKGRTLAGVAAVLLVLLAAGWWFGSPWWTLWRIREAARARDAEAIAAYIDFPALRASTLEQLGPRFGPLKSRLARPAIEALVSPPGLRLILGNDRRGGGEPEKVELVRTGTGEFRVKREDIDFVFRRHGLGWKLEEIRLRSAR